MRFLPGWVHLRKLRGTSEVRCDSCRFGSQHLKPFRFLGVNVDLASVSMRCICRSKHVKVEGSLTKASATYTPKLVTALGGIFAAAIRKSIDLQDDLDAQRVDGLENQLVNEVAVSSSWEEMSSWTFKKQSHINILEESSVLRLVNLLAREKRSLRVVNLVDSYVVRGATSKGRTSSRGLSPILRRVNAMLVASFIFMTLPYVPTRWNASDDPTRGVAVRSVYGSLSLEDWAEEDLYLLSNLPPLRKWASLWVRLVLRLVGPTVLRFADRSWYGRDAFHLHPGFRFLQSQHDSSLGFPGSLQWPFDFSGLLPCLFWASHRVLARPSISLLAWLHLGSTLDLCG